MGEGGGDVALADADRPSMPDSFSCRSAAASALRSVTVAAGGHTAEELERRDLNRGGSYTPSVEPLQFRILGPLDVRHGGVSVPVCGWRERTVLAALLLQAGRVVPLSRLTESVWDQDPPPSAEKAIRNSVSALRRSIAQAGGPVSVIATDHTGYRLRPDECSLDALDFQRRVTEAGRLAAAGQAAEAAALLREALGSWRGPVLAGIGGPVIEVGAARLEEQRLTALEDCLDLELGLGSHQYLTGELQELVREQPLRERLTGQLMLALYRSGRQAEALDTYRRLAKRLTGDLGLDPSAEITRLHQAILRQDPALDLARTGGHVSGSTVDGTSAADTLPAEARGTARLARGGGPPQPPGSVSSGSAGHPAVSAETRGDLAHGTVSAETPAAAASPAPAPLTPVPAQLPLDVPGFTGRGAELARLHAQLPPASETQAATATDASGADTSAAKSATTRHPGGATVVISAIGGTAGVGKTALAVRFAHEVADRYPDGQLYVNLRGFDPSGSPLKPAAALRGFLGALRTSPEQIPPDVPQQAALYRTLLADKRMLVLLDNARDADQVRPLLPASPRCLILVTSRSQLTGLMVAEGAQPLTLDVLAEDEAIELLAARVGQQRLDTEPGAAAELVSLCARLPLALAITAARAATRPGLPLTALAAELRQARGRLDALSTGDAATDIRIVFSWSHQQLSQPAARMFRLLGLHPGRDTDTYAAASLADISVQQAHHLLAELIRSHLLIEHAPGRYTFHDLLRAYARELADTTDAEDERRGALTRLFDHYLHTAAIAMDTLFPADRVRRPHILSPATPVPPVTNPQAARGWLDAELPSLVAAAAQAAESKWLDFVVHLAATISRYLDGGYTLEAITIYGHARQAARLAGDLAAEAAALTNLGVVNWQLGSNRDAADNFRQALTLASWAGNRTEEARALHNLGLVELQQSRYQQAADHFRQALTLCRETGDLGGEASALSNLGVVDRRLGHHQQAIDHQQQALTLWHETGDRSGEARALIRLGVIDLQLGSYRHAAGHFRQALDLLRETGNRNGEADALIRLGEAHLRLGHHQQATDHFEQALTLCRETGDLGGQAEALNGLGEAHLRLGDHQQATVHYQQALDLFREIGDRNGETDALNGLGEVLLAADQPGDARIQHTTALGLASETGDTFQQARAHDDLGNVGQAVGDLGQAREHWEQALALYIALEAPEADQVRAKLREAC